MYGETSFSTSGQTLLASLSWQFSPLTWNISWPGLSGTECLLSDSDVAMSSSHSGYLEDSCGKRVSYSDISVEINVRVQRKYGATAALYGVLEAVLREHVPTNSLNPPKTTSPMKREAPCKLAKLTWSWGQTRNVSETYLLDWESTAKPGFLQAIFLYARFSLHRGQATSSLWNIEDTIWAKIFVP